MQPANKHSLAWAYWAYFSASDAFNLPIYLNASTLIEEFELTLPNTGFDDTCSNNSYFCINRA
jgi:hypothetical protein